MLFECEYKYNKDIIKEINEKIGGKIVELINKMPKIRVEEEYEKYSKEKYIDKMAQLLISRIYLLENKVSKKEVDKFDQMVKK